MGASEGHAEARRSMGIEPTSRRSRANSTVLKTAPFTRSEAPPRSCLARFLGSYGCAAFQGSVQPTLVQFIFVEAEQMTHLVEHRDADLFEKFVTASRESFEVALVQRNARRLVID
jgi:hypothetical protein